jgi:hypothetical protein
MYLGNEVGTSRRMRRAKTVMKYFSTKILIEIN